MAKIIEKIEIKSLKLKWKIKRLIRKYFPLLEFDKQILDSPKIKPHSSFIVYLKGFDFPFLMLIFKVNLSSLKLSIFNQKEREADPIYVLLDMKTKKLAMVGTRYHDHHFDWLVDTCLKSNELDMRGTHPVVYIKNNFIDKATHGLLPKPLPKEERGWIGWDIKRTFKNPFRKKIIRIRI